MTAQQLKNSILQMAVQGKLVPQDPNDEPASVLLERIKAEKQELIKAGKIKKDKKTSEIFRGASRNLPYAFCEQVGKEIRDISDEVPFEIPDSWEWVRCSSLATLLGGYAFKSTQYKDNGVRVIRISDFSEDGLLYDEHKYYDELSELQKYVIKEQDTLMCMTGGTVGKTCYLSRIEQKMYLNQRVACIRADEKIVYPLCLYYVLISPFIKEIVLSSKTSTNDNISMETISNFLIPVPPFAEQYRIVTKIEELLPYIEKYAQAETQLTALNTTFPEALKKSILQEAVQGRLVPQDPNDEPASVLLERIRAEKQSLIKAGKIKKDKHESIIVTRDKIPYEIPDGWVWCALNDVVIQVADIDHKMPQTVEDDGYPYISPLDFTDKGINYDNAKKIGKEDFDKLSVKVKPKRNDIIFPRYGTIGVIRLVETDIDFLVSYSCCTIQNTSNMDYRYVYYVLKSQLIRDEINKYVNKTTQPNVGLKSIKSFLFPLPPLAEQNRIATKIEELMQYCDKL